MPVIILTIGHDGSGNHSEFRSCNMGTQNLNLGGMRLIEVHSGNELLYRESSFGPDTEVPLFIGKFLRVWTYKLCAHVV